MIGSEIFSLIALVISIIALILAALAFNKAKINEDRLRWAGITTIDVSYNLGQSFRHVKVTPVKRDLEEARTAIDLILKELDLKYIPEPCCPPKLVSTKKDKEP